MFSIYLLGFLIYPSWRGLPSRSDSERSEALLESADREQDAVNTMLPWRDVLRLSSTFAPFWLAANWTFNASLCSKCGTGTSVASNTIISSTGTLFTFLLSLLFLKDERDGLRVAMIKGFCVSLSFVGVTFVTSFDGSSKEGESQWGDMLALISAFFFGAYSVLLKMKIPDENTVHLPMFFGFLGVVSTAICIPILVFLHVAGIETFELVPWGVVGYLTVNSLVGTVLSDLLWAQGVILTSPLVVNIGMSLTIPLAFLADKLNPTTEDPPMSWEYLLGASLVLGAFLGITGVTAVSVHTETEMQTTPRSSMCPDADAEREGEEVEARHGPASGSDTPQDM